CRLQNAGDDLADGRFAGAGFSYEAESFPRADNKAHAVDGLHGTCFAEPAMFAEIARQILGNEKRAIRTDRGGDLSNSVHQWCRHWRGAGHGLQHAARWSPSTDARAGRLSAQAGAAFAQRGRKWQPVGRRANGGTRPRIDWSSSLRSMRGR